MSKVKQYNGQLVVTVKQEQKDESISYLQIEINGHKSLSARVLAGTITAEIFRHLNAQKACGLKNFRSNRPLTIQIKADGQIIADTAKVEKKVALKLVPRSEHQLGVNLFTALTFIKGKVELKGVETKGALQEKYVSDNDKLMLERSKKAAIEEIAVVVENDSEAV